MHVAIFTHKDLDLNGKSMAVPFPSPVMPFDLFGVAFTISIEKSSQELKTCFLAEECVPHTEYTDLDVAPVVHWCSLRMIVEVDH